MIIVSKDNCLVTGRVTKKGGELTHVGDKGYPKYRFSVRYKNDKTESGEWDAKYLDCELFGDTECKDAPTLQGFEMVMCAGKIRTSTYKGKDGQEKTSTVLQCDFVMVGGNSAQNAGQMPMQEPSGFHEEDPNDGFLPF